jgi:N-acetylmuramoyl-L-alanine amidase
LQPRGLLFGGEGEEARARLGSAIERSGNVRCKLSARGHRDLLPASQLINRRVGKHVVTRALGFGQADSLPVMAVSPTPLICLDPGHGTIPAIGRQTEPIGPGSSKLKIKDGGGTAGEAPVALAIALRTRALLKRDGYRVAMTRTGRTYAGGNIDRARFCNVRHAALMIRIHADGATDSSLNGIKTLVPALHPGWTDDIYAASVRAARKVQAAVVRQTGGRNLGLVQRSDLTGFNWANVPAILVECGFMTNPAERRLLQSALYQLKIARGLVAGAEAFAPR